MVLRLLMIFIIALISTSKAGTIDPNIPDQRYIKYGIDFEYVGKICGSYKENERFCGSVVAIDDHHFLTAAHVVKGSTSCFVYIKDKEFCVKTIAIHKDFDEKKFGIADIAIGYCEESFNLSFYPSLYDNDNEEGKLCSISGYGFTGTFITGAHKYDNRRRAGSNIIDSIQEDLLICSPSRSGDKNRTSLEFLIASGDSGGGLFIDHKLAGINSCIMGVDKGLAAKYNEESGHTRISKFIPWISENKRK